MVTKAAGLGCFGIHVESRGANVESAGKRAESRVQYVFFQRYERNSPITGKKEG
ncbi:MULTISPECIES: hypothetical protein [unclassified Bacillus (in: firmicutes)]|uniref:hypothetical protein n=1 Tax=unclassified Bacillus (in: firmicutes) TaxID=185979 RepID=UPI0015965A79|nr:MULTISPECIES: hypothetical protein [unclassified Bacillus (in: firmicutes)]